MKKYIYPLFFTLLYIGSLILIFKIAFFRLEGINTGREALVFELLQKSGIILRQVLTYGLIVVCLHLAPMFFMIRSTLIVRNRYLLTTLQCTLYYFVTLISLWFCVLAFNQLYFPRSNFSQLLPLFSTETISLTIGIVALALFILLGFIPALYSLSAQFHFMFKRYRWMRIVSLLLPVLGIIKLVPFGVAVNLPASKQPNIIFIGLDSVAPIHLQHQQNNHSYIRSLLDSGTSFSNTITPLGRTYPAWVSILTGKYPIHNGARFNLTPLEQANEEVGLLPKLLNQQGYYNVYAQDERKFNNLDESFGFNVVIGPKVGAAEFILTKISDMPMVNIALLVPGSEKLFPFIAQNRADELHYSPEKFVKEVLNNIPDNNDKPLFLAVHFCLAHYPYSWRNSTGSTDKSSINLGHTVAITTLEKQIETLMIGLQERGRLDNALVVILSDHGESVGYEDGMWIDAEMGDQLYAPDSITKSPVALKSLFSGHGTDVLDKSQYTTLLSFKGYGTMASLFKAEKQTEITSLVDISPTVLSSLGIAIPDGLDGRDLLKILEKTNMANVVLAETGIIFSSLSNLQQVDEGALIQESKDYYMVNEQSGNLILKPEKLAELVAAKNYALHSKDWMLSFIRSRNGLKHPPIVILVHKPSGRWTLGENVSLIEEAPMETLVKKAKTLLENEIADFSGTWPLKLVSAQSLY